MHTDPSHRIHVYGLCHVGRDSGNFGMIRYSVQINYSLCVYEHLKTAASPPILTSEFSPDKDFIKICIFTLKKFPPQRFYMPGNHNLNFADIFPGFL